MKKILFLLSIIMIGTNILRAQVYTYGDFSTSLPAGWQNIDADGDGYKWVIGNGYALSYSWYNNKILTPNNWLITPEIDLTNAVAGTDLTYYVATYDNEFPAEHYQVLLSNGTASTTSFTEVLYDETLNASNTSFKFRSISLNSYIGQKVYIAFVHNNCSDNHAFAIAEPQVVAPKEIGIYSLAVPEYQPLNDSILVSGYVMNVGSAPLNSFNVSYSVNGGAAVAEETFSGLNVERGDTVYFSHSVKIPTPNIEDINLKVIIKNNDNDLDWEDDNEAEMTIYVYDKHNTHHVMVEQFTTANCSNCPAATQQLKNLLQNRNDYCWVAHHQGYGTDGLTHSLSANQLLAFYNDGGSVYAPAMMLNRKVLNKGETTPVFSTYSISKEILDKAAAVPAFVTIDITNASFDQTSRQLSVTIEGEILRTITEDAADLRLGLYLKEDNLKTTPGQSGSALGTNYIHNNVMRANISGVWGDNAIITSNTAGTQYSKTFTDTIPTTYDINNCALVAFVTKYNTSILKRDILNSKGITLTDIINNKLPDNDIVMDAAGNTISSISETENRLFSIYPNPATDNITIISDSEIKNVEIINITGQIVKSHEGNAKNISVSGLVDGIYFVRCLTAGGISVKKFIKQ